ncbi:hypothetical protein TFLX_02063 [Thermoflexales bacterium]|nr:hypothetical protein TFLX_02063 [Thermoflexales bacterium]
MPNSTLSRSTIRSMTWHKTGALVFPIIFLAAMLGLFCLTLPSVSANTLVGQTATQNSPEILSLAWSSFENDSSTSVAWGDYDNDGDLDLAVGNHNPVDVIAYPVRLYQNVRGVLTVSAVWSSSELQRASSVAWGDYDNDGDLDLAVGNYNQPNHVYRNEHGNLTVSAVYTTTESDSTEEVAWADVDGDGDLDLTAMNSCYIPGCRSVRLYRNDEGSLTTSAVWSSIEAGYTNSGAWADVDGDSDLDLAIGNWGPVMLYRNDGALAGIPHLTMVYSSTENHDTANSVAWGDVDGDGDPDLAVGNWVTPNRVYRNDNGMLTASAVWASSENDTTTSVAWGDYDGDGDLDLAVGNGTTNGGGIPGTPNRLYRNDGGTLTTSAVWTSPEADNTQSVAWGDVDGDGDLDLAMAGGYPGQPNRLYRNAGSTLEASAAWSFAEALFATSVAWGDYDGDDDLDLAVGSWDRIRLYPNHNGVLTYTAIWSSTADNETQSVAWGDVDGDGDLDLAVGNHYQADQIYRNDGVSDGVPQLTAIWLSLEAADTHVVAWADYDSDGDLDLAASGDSQPNRLYRNEGGNLTPSATWSSLEPERTYALAWGDSDGDGDLDLAVANYCSNYAGCRSVRLYRNDAGAFLANAIWSSLEVDNSTSLAWGDVDSDGDLDLAVGNDGQPNRLYLNVNGSLASSASWSSIEVDDTTSVAWADYDHDGDLDLAVGNGGSPGQPNRLYRNDGGTLTAYASWTALEADSTQGLAWGDVDKDGDLDLAVANVYGAPNRIYTNRRYEPVQPGAVPMLQVTRPGPNANSYALSKIWSDPIIPLTYTLSDRQGRPVKMINAWYSPNGGGQWLPAVAASGTSTTNLTTSSTGQAYTYMWDVAASGFFGQSDNVVFRLQAVPAIVTGTHNAMPGPYLYGAYASHTFPFRVRGTQVRVVSDTQPLSNAIVYRLPAGQSSGGSLFADAVGVPFHTDGQGYLQGRGELKMGDQLLALAPVHSSIHYEGVVDLDGMDDYVIRNPFNTAPITATTISFWMRSDDHNGQGTPFSYATASDADEFLITNYNDLALYRGAISVTTGISVTDGLWHHIAVTWRESDGQVKLYKDGSAAYTGTLAASSLITGGSLVLGQDQDYVGGGFDPVRAFKGSLDEIHVWSIALDEAQIQADMNDPLNGDEDGLVLAWSFDAPVADAVPDRTPNYNEGTLLGAAWNSRSFGGYTVYQTNGVPTAIGLGTHPMTQTGVQTLTVSAAHPLILFDLDVSLEWDAHKQTAYLQQLENDLAKASAYLYDFTNGQVALGQLRVHQNADEWLSSQVVVYATNRLRPLAVQGGIVTEPITDPQRSNIIYAPGQVRMGAVWNRYGEPGGDISDWPLALAHELSHYLLYQEDVYLGLSDAGLLIPMNTCTGSVMGDMYNPDNTEFIDDQQHWDMNCVNTLANRTLGRTEWTTNRLWYPWLITPTLMNTGPSRMPFDLTRVTIAAPLSPTDALDDPTFYLDYQAGESSSSEARAYIFRSSDQGDYVVDLGSPLGGQNRIYARGAQPGDRLCVLDAARRQYGCEIIELGDERLGLKADTTWRPVVQLTPVNSQTIAIEVSGLSEALALHARLYPENGFGGEAITLASAGVTYSGTFHLAFPAMLGHVQIWIDEPATEDNPRREAMVTYSLGGNPGNWLALRGGWPALRGGWPALRGGWPALRGGWSASRSSSAPLASPGGQMLFFTADPTSIPEGNLYTMGGMTGLPPLPTGKTAIGQGYSLIASPNVTQLITGSISFQYLSMDVLAEQADEEQLTIHYWDGQTWQALETIRSPYFNMVSAPSHGPGVYALMVGVTIPQIEAIDPVQAVNNVTTTLTISGHDFLPPVDALLIGSTTTHTLLLVSVSPISITAIITPDLPAHEYRVQVINRYDASFYDASSSGSLPFALYDPAAACFYDFFESGSSKWQRSGTWNIITLPKGNQALTDSPGNSYGVTVSPTLSATTSNTSAAFSLNGCSHPILTFRHDYVIDNRPPSQDGGRVEISTDNGVTWRELARYAGGLRTSLSKVLVDSEWADVQWKDVEIDLSAYTGTVRLRFTLEVDRVGADRGWVLDQVMVRAKPHGTQVFLPAILR